MSTSLLEVIDSAGFDLSTLEGANWLIAQQNQFEELVEKAEEFIEEQSYHDNEMDEE